MHPRVVLALALVVLAFAGCAHRSSPAGDGARAALQQRERDFLAALGARDAERTASFFAEDAVLHVANMPPVEGRAAIARLYGNVFRFMRASEATPERMTIAASADLAYGTGRVSNEFAGEDGPVRYSGKYLLVWERGAGEWEVVLYGISNDAAEPGR